MTFYAPTRSTGLIIPYPSITVTAQDGAEVLLELTLSPPDVADEDLEVLQLRILPTTTTTTTTGVDFPENAPENSTDQIPNGSSSSTSSSSSSFASAALFHAISTCQDLNPDPRLPGDDDDDDDEEMRPAPPFDPTAPGATGWITSENLADFMDDEGNFRMPPGGGGGGGVTIIGGGEDDDDEGEFADGDDGQQQQQLEGGDGASAAAAARIVGGGGAGSVRRREEAGLDADEMMTTGEGDGESKWQRTS
jgi:nucleotide-sensitive chloride channel 1A